MARKAIDLFRVALTIPEYVIGEYRKRRKETGAPEPEKVTESKSDESRRPSVIRYGESTVTIGGVTFARPRRRS